MSRNLLIAFLITSFALTAQTEYIVEEFKKSTDFYTAFNAGSGLLITSINNSDFNSGNESYSINYTFNNGSNSYFSVFKNYANATQDFSFQTDSISIAIKGGSVHDEIAIRLWEDQDFNGVFDGTDEVYTSIKTSCNSSNWSTIKFALNDFIKVTGSGNNILDLNRIRAYDIAIHNGGTTAHSNQVLIDKFTLHSTYTPPVSGNAQLSGSFIQLWNTSGCKCGNWSQTQWDEELQQMKSRCLNKLIIQYGVYGDHAWYTPSSLSFVNYQSDALNKIFAAAEKENIEVVLGLYFDENWNSSNKENVTEYNSILIKHQATMNELYNLFGSSPAFGGWYIPQEINDYEWQTDPAKSLLFDWIKDVTNYSNNLSNKPIFIAPFFNLWQPADVIENWYDELLTEAPNLSAVYPQDGVGIQRKSVNYHVPLYYNAIQSACSKNNRDFGATVESFNQLTGWPIDNGTFSAESAEWNNFKKQIWEADLHLPSDIIQFSYSYMQSNLNNKAQSLASNYLNYVNCFPTKSVNLNRAENVVYNRHLNQLQFSETFEHFQVYAINGQLIDEGYHKKTHQLQPLKPGLYLLKTNKKANLKFIVY